MLKAAGYKELLNKGSKAAPHYMLSKEQGNAVCDAKNDAILNKSRYQKYSYTFNSTHLSSARNNDEVKNIFNDAALIK